MPVFKKELSLNAIVQVISLAILLATAGMMYRDVTAESEKIAMRVAALEQAQKRNQDDHDLLIEIRHDLRLLRQQVERMAASSTRLGSN